MESNKGFFFVAHMMVKAPVVFFVDAKIRFGHGMKSKPSRSLADSNLPSSFRRKPWVLKKSDQAGEKDCYPPKVQHGSPENGTLEYQIPFGNHYF